MRLTFVLLLIAAIFIVQSNYLCAKWEKIENGLLWGEFDSPKEYKIGKDVRDGMKKYEIIVLKINPKYYSFKLLTASQNNNVGLTCRDWCKKYNLIAAINASMYGKDHITSTGFMKNYNHINNGKINPRFGAFIAFNPIDSKLPGIQIIDRHSQNWKALIKKYNTVIQNYRMLSTNQYNLWSQGSKFYSTAAIGIDKKGNALFIISRLPYTTHDFIDILLHLPIDIYNAAYLEGGPEASLYLKYGEVKKEIIGSYETDFSLSDDNKNFWTIPNVIGISKKEK